MRRNWDVLKLSGYIACCSSIILEYFTILKIITKSFFFLARGETCCRYNFCQVPCDRLNPEDSEGDSIPDLDDHCPNQLGNRNGYKTSLLLCFRFRCSALDRSRSEYHILFICMCSDLKFKNWENKSKNNIRKEKENKCYSTL